MKGQTDRQTTLKHMSLQGHWCSAEPEDVRWKICPSDALKRRPSTANCHPFLSSDDSCHVALKSTCESTTEILT